MHHPVSSEADEAAPLMKHRHAWKQGWDGMLFTGGGKPPRYRINFRAVESLKNLNFERKYEGGEGWGNVSMFDKTFGQPL